MSLERKLFLIDIIKERIERYSPYPVIVSGYAAFLSELEKEVEEERIKKQNAENQSTHKEK